MRVIVDLVVCLLHSKELMLKCLHLMNINFYVIVTTPPLSSVTSMLPFVA